MLRNGRNRMRHCSCVARRHTCLRCSLRSPHVSGLLYATHGRELAQKEKARREQLLAQGKPLDVPAK